MDDTQKFDKTYVNLKDVLDIISIFYDTTLFCKRDTDQPKMLCDAIKKSDRVHSIVLDEEYMKEKFKKEFGDCIADVCRQFLNGKSPVYLNLATIETTSDRFHVMHQTCSKCGETQPWKEYPNFCWNCGARFTNKEIDEQFEHVLKSLRDDILSSLHNSEYRQVLTMNDVDMIIHKKFNEVIGE